jgi:hypothetical protein
MALMPSEECVRRPGASPLKRMTASWSGPPFAGSNRIQGCGAMLRAQWRALLGLFPGHRACLALARRFARQARDKAAKANGADLGLHCSRRHRAFAPEASVAVDSHRNGLTSKAPYKAHPRKSARLGGLFGNTFPVFAPDWPILGLRSARTGCLLRAIIACNRYWTRYAGLMRRIARGKQRV